jgi:ectoine hydroxylase
MRARDPYWSRTEAEWEIAERQDPVIWGDAAQGPLSAAQMRSFRDEGYLVMPRLFSPSEVSRLLSEAHELAAEPSVRHSEATVLEPDSDAVRSIFRVHRASRTFDALSADARLSGVARQILGSDVYVHQSRINFKPGFDGREFHFHSDFETWHVEDGMPRMRALSASLLLTDNTPLNGPLLLVPRSHLSYVRCVGKTPDEHYKQSLRAQRYGVPDVQALTRLVDEGGLVQATGPAGSVVFFDCNLMHGSAGNLSPFARHNIFIVFNSIDNRLTTPFAPLSARPDFLSERSPVPLASH